MAAAGSGRVAESCGEVNDGLAVIPEAETEIGHTHIYVLTTRARCTHAETDVREVSDACYPECF